MPRDNDYAKTIVLWFKSMEVTNEQTKTAVDFHTKEIELHGKLLSLSEEQLEHDESRLQKARGDFEKYLEENPE